ncbi:hypothetical protein PP768_gp22 [Escherichia phage vB_EcoP-ZQ2]|uniref:Uncharacterized protein n=1 Tax=Escherichia phage vB_EcoP-ZQ2 TaxID=2810370 RepID=A0A8F3C7J4_9CAUD|nr:hypothetical protein PP768_gp22 [Escherichia phage vB_EcoP-ZQ2]QWY13157.1 hypothetical protein [Escherichia phage vB_EcoP-ZQ2]
MSIYAFDIDITGMLRKQEPYYLEEPEVVSKMLSPRQSVFFPDCEESHEIIGSFFLYNLQLNTEILTEPKVYDLTEYADFETFFPGIRFYKVPGWEMIVEHNLFNKTLSVYFRPIPKGRKIHHEIHNDYPQFC